MTHTLFIRLLHHEDKEEALARRIAALREGATDGDVYAVMPESFGQVPNTPFCYWVSERIRRLFTQLPPFESDGRTVRVGLQTGDDFRFVRAWWEVPAERILDAASGPDWRDDLGCFQEWCRRRTYEGKRWAPFAKGGKYSPYYADIHLVVNWEEDGAEIRNFVDPRTGRTYSRPQNTDYYFRPGLTWGDRTSALLSVRPWPAGGVFSVKGSAGFFDDDLLPQICGLMNTIPFNAFLEMLVNAGSTVSRSYQVGIIGVVPFADGISSAKNMGESLERGWCIKERIDTRDNTSHAFLLPAVLQTKGTSLIERTGAWRERTEETKVELARIQMQIDEIAFDLYGFTEEERNAVSRDQGNGLNLEDADDGDVLVRTAQDARQVAAIASCVAELLAWCVGIPFGRFDVRLALDQSLAPAKPDPFDPLPVCPPGMLVGPDGLPAKPGGIVSEEWLRARPDAATPQPEGSVENLTIPDADYPLRISWRGILVDDPGLSGAQLHAEDIVRRVREVLDLIWKEKASEIEQEACEILGVSDLRDYFRRPSGFFADHLKRYSKSRRQAPIYWPLSTASGSYTLWLYYHRLTDQTLYTCVNDFVDPKLTQVAEDMTRLRGQERRSTSEEKEFEKLSDLEQELRDFRDEILRIAKFWKPNLNDGVQITAAPLWRLFRHRPWQKRLEETWRKLEKGDYDWAHLALSIWPERVVKASHGDRSYAIAHGLEEALWEEVEVEKKTKSGKIKKKIEWRPTDLGEEELNRIIAGVKARASSERRDRP